VILVIRRLTVVAALLLAGCHSNTSGPADPTSGIARMTFVSGSVLLRRSGHPDRHDATVGTWLLPHDEVATGSDGSAQIVYADETRLDVQPGSLLVLEEPAHTSGTGGKFGVVTSKKPFYHRDSGKNVDVVIDPDSTAKVSSQPDQVSFVVDKGAGSLKQKDVVVAVKQGEGVEAKGSGPAAKFTVLSPPALVTPADGAETAVTDPAKGATTLQWSMISGAGTYRVQVADEATFAQPAVDLKDHKERTAIVPGLSGTNFWRVQAVDANGHEGNWSAPSRFTVVKRATPTSTVPPGVLPLHIDDLQVKGSVALIRGTTLPGAALMVDDQPVKVDESGHFNEHIAIDATGTHELVVRATKGGSSAEERRTIEIAP
jgi:hypothetical protein